MDMKSIMYRIIAIFMLFSTASSGSQVNLQQNFSLTELKLKNSEKEIKHPDISRKTSSVLPISIGVLTAIYLLNPMVEYTDKKVFAGLTKEF